MARFRAKQVTVEAGRAGQSSVDRESARRRCYLLLARDRRSCCSSPAPTSPTCCSRAARRGRARWRCGCRSAPAGGRWCGSSSPSRRCWRRSAARSACWWRGGRSTGIIAMVPGAEDTSFLSTSSIRRRWCSPRRVAIGTGLLFGLFPALHSTRPDLVTAIKSTAGQPSRRPRRLALPHRPGDDADRALDDAADPGRAVHQEPDEHQRASTWASRRRTLVTFGALAGAERLHAGAIEGAVRAASRTSSPRCPASAASASRIVPLLAGNNWGNGVTVAGLRRRTRTPTPARCTTRSARATSARWACRCSPAASSRAATSWAAPKVAIVNEAFARKFNLGRDAVGKRMARERRRAPSSTSRSSAS